MIAEGLEVESSKKVGRTERRFEASLRVGVLKKMMKQ